MGLGRVSTNSQKMLKQVRHFIETEGVPLVACQSLKENRHDVGHFRVVVAADRDGVSAATSDEALMASLGTLVEEICQRYEHVGNAGLLKGAVASLAPVLERSGLLTVNKYLVGDAIAAIQLLYEADEEEWSYKYMRDWAGHVSTRLRWAIGRERPPFRWDPDL